MHGHTYLAHPMACAAALAVQRVIAEERLLDNVQAMGARLYVGERVLGESLTVLAGSR
jgi:adenosylmethionine-8-amino-7-oxononanoate aminotransferase